MHRSVVLHMSITCHSKSSQLPTTAHRKLNIKSQATTLRNIVFWHLKAAGTFHEMFRQLYEAARTVLQQFRNASKQFLYTCVCC